MISFCLSIKKLSQVHCACNLTEKQSFYLEKTLHLKIDVMYKIFWVTFVIL